MKCIFVPLAWPPSRSLVSSVLAWNGDQAQLPDECNLLIFREPAEMPSVGWSFAGGIAV